MTKLSKGWLRVISSLLTSIAAGWLGSIVILPGIFAIESFEKIFVLLTYSIPFAILALVLAARIEDRLL